MSTRATYIASLVTSLQSITVANGFSSTVKKVLRGVRSREDFSNELPGLALWNEKAPRVESSFGESQRDLVFHIWGFVMVDARNNDYSALDNLLADVEKALMTESFNSHYGRTIIGDLTIYEGGQDDPFGEFDLVFSLAYEYEYAEP